MNERNLGFDLLRAVGLLSICLAHVNPPEWLFQIRTFDVVMMVCVSTLSFTEYSRPIPYFNYIKGRLKRLLIPSWEYILILGASFGIIAWLTNTPTAFPIKTLLMGMLTLSGVGYLWIIRVFIYNAFLNPYIIKISNFLSRLWGGRIIFVLVGYVVYALVKYFCMKSEIPHLATLAEASILDFWAYGLIAIIAYWMYHLSRKSACLISILLLLGVIISIYIVGFVPNTYKYPPDLQYILWGLFVVSVGFVLIKEYPIKKLPRFFIFVSANSMWIYFWHLIPVNFINLYPQYIPDLIAQNWLIKWLIIMVFSLCMTLAQKYIKIKIKETL